MTRRRSTIYSRPTPRLAALGREVIGPEVAWSTSGTVDRGDGIIQSMLRRWLLAASLALLLPVSPATGAVQAQLVASTVPVGVPLNLSVPVGVPYPSMASCRSVPLTDCFRFADGRVVGQPSLAPVLLVAHLFRWPLTSCTRITRPGLSPAVVEVEASAGFPIAVGPGSCADLRRQVVDNTAYLIAPGVTRVIPPTDGSVLVLIGPATAAANPVTPSGS